MDNCEINNSYGVYTEVAFVENLELAWAKPMYDASNRTLQPSHIAISPLSSLTAHSQILWPSMLIRPAIYPNLSPPRLPNLQLEPAPYSPTNQDSSATVGEGCQPLLPNLRSLRPKTAEQSREVPPQVVSGKSVLTVVLPGLTLSSAVPRKPQMRRRRRCPNPGKKAISDKVRNSVVRRKKDDPTLSQRRLAG